MNDPLSYRQGGRGTGKTTRLIKATPTGGVYIVNSAGMRNIVEQYIKQIGRNGEIKVVTARQAIDYLRGRRPPVALDHVLFEEELDPELNYAVAARAPLVLTNDYEGDVITTWHVKS